MGMEQQASEKLGEPVKLVATVSTKGTGKKTMLGAGFGAIGAIGAAVVNAMASRGSTSLADYKGYVVLGLAEKNLGLFKQAGLLKPSCGDILDTIPLEQISSFDVAGGALTVPLTIGLVDGRKLDFEVPRAHKGKVEKLRAALKL